ncbi:hypothetical protein EJ06DRAFT_552015 [Trichodelitschia bisporula]|uniref:Uncharacterized protein n=1 Tax=Trichodelitschia bisporula TaxID=703511 RepID=A0A6G1HJH5_9PEZI|nr:hypothetical protein EJ06DRAFT_552015 [Trichodelitschia bisporula]
MTSGGVATPETLMKIPMVAFEPLDDGRRRNQFYLVSDGSRDAEGEFLHEASNIPLPSTISTTQYPSTVSSKSTISTRERLRREKYERRRRNDTDRTRRNREIHEHQEMPDEEAREQRENRQREWLRLEQDATWAVWQAKTQRSQWLSRRNRPKELVKKPEQRARRGPEWSLWKRILQELEPKLQVPEPKLQELERTLQESNRTLQEPERTLQEPEGASQEPEQGGGEHGKRKEQDNETLSKQIGQQAMTYMEKMQKHLFLERGRQDLEQKRLSLEWDFHKLEMEEWFCGKQLTLEPPSWVRYEEREVSFDNGKGLATRWVKDDDREQRDTELKRKRRALGSHRRHLDSQRRDLQRDKLNFAQELKRNWS